MIYLFSQKMFGLHIFWALFSQAHLIPLAGLFPYPNHFFLELIGQMENLSSVAINELSKQFRQNRPQ
jgi:hypothetical protein